MSLRGSLIITTCALVALVFPAVAHAVTLHGTVGPEAVITLTNDAGAAVTTLDAGTYTIEVDDKSEFHNFHLSGPGVDVATEVGTVGKVTWTVTFQGGVYNYVCDPHSANMHGTFTVNAAPKTPTLHGTVGPEFTITLTDDAGNKVTHLDPGTYTIEVDDKSEFHDFHLTGPGVDVATDVEQIGKVTWTVTFQDGVYTYICDPHSVDMRGAFTVGNAQLPPEPAPVPPATPAPKNKLVATVGPGFTISLTLNGKRVKTLKAGTYTIVVRDLSASHDFHLAGPGVNKRTSVAGKGTSTWRLSLRKGTYRYVCDPHAALMKGSFRVI